MDADWLQRGLKIAQDVCAEARQLRVTVSSVAAATAAAAAANFMEIKSSSHALSYAIKKMGSRGIYICTILAFPNQDVLIR